MSAVEAAALAEAESLAEALEVPLVEAAELLADDREGYVPPTALAPAAADLAEGSLLTKGTIDAYIAAVVELWRLQAAHGNANTENPRGAAVRGFLEQRGRQRGKHDRASFKDRGTDGIQAGYSHDEWLRIQDLLLSGAAYMPQNLRTRVDLLFGHYYLLRGENRRKMELADLSLLDYPSSEGPTPCGCLVTLLRDGKLNKTAKKEFMGALRHKDPLLCTQGALAQLFFWRWHVAGESPPSFRRRQDWYRIKVLVGRDREQELSYPTQLQETWRIFGAAGLVASKKTHLPRRVGAQDAETYGTSLAQISQAGRWNQSVLCQAYLTHLPRQFMRIVAGFSASPADYFLARAANEPPYVLQKQLWPWIEEWEPRFEARARRQCWAEGGLDDDDLAADGFLKLMRRLRIVLLQDLAVLQPRYPSLPFFAYAPFNGSEWDEFAVAVRSDAAGATEPLSLLVQRALPELSGVLESRREALLQNNQRLAIRLEARLEGIQGGLDSLLQGKVPITFTGHFGAGAVGSPYLELQYGSGSGSRASSTRCARRCSPGQGLYSAGCLEGVGGRDCRSAGRTGARRDVGKPLAPGERDQGAVLSPEGDLGRALGPHGVRQERGGGSCRARALTRRPELEPARRRAQTAPPAGPGPGPDTGTGRDPRAR
ncbi:hypothetical protein HZS61_008390 [Fusarium oxysporum f. sp. conglutinans]|uniref:Ndc10 domain-containing protein n=1 Tax=Fusarium oxysporum f. sp. conglutinans TaxID=100902 RepID=A0A8H6LP09_FUSOX|nr:hypothetical protein HZS61_008230 [Fusarium oxysporum f. sp. conglutinans]KAH7465276.1 hypothetical protein FOMA001_g17039 [Fusarium oxysporum f. sp. matthiolae]KAF6528062.1 hypothetical protein HZS61_008364 [Fusarium oxysporum f. sp. conglutinans]KAF6528088.1 hypothetical protein HZS61_008390 [Fusarium oxysporum f. sp. conglutinans]KAG7001190.1 hypothetical protein FocnCong_v012860 [Fusarium oxysporum f. sp. conglutinans]